MKNVVGHILRVSSLGITLCCTGIVRGGAGQDAAGSISSGGNGNGIPETDFYPMIEYYRAKDYRANPLCELDPEYAHQNADENSKPLIPSVQATDYPYRFSIGLSELTKKMLESGKSVASLSDRDVAWTAKERQKKGDWESLLQAGIAGSVYNYRRSNVLDSSFRIQFGKAFQPSKQVQEPFCYALGNFSRISTCLSNYEYKDNNEVLKQLSPGNNFGLEDLPTKCHIPVAQGDDPLNFGLERHNGHTPDFLNPSELVFERKVYYLLYKAVDKLQRYAEYRYLTGLDQIATGQKTEFRPPVGSDTGIHTLFRDSQIFKEILPGWKVERVFHLNEPRFKGGPTMRTPYAVLCSKDSDLLVVLRHPQTTYESRLALYNQQAFKYLYNFTGETHDGSSTIYRTLSGALEFYIKKFALRNNILSRQYNTQQTVTITFAAAELPSTGAALLLASHIAESLENLRSTDPSFYDMPVDVSAVLFGATYVGNQEAMNNIKRSVEIRNVYIEGDSYDLFPTAFTVSCDETLLQSRTGIYSGIEYSYATIPGTVVLPLSELTERYKLWNDPKAILQLAAIKDCALGCALASSECPQDSIEMNKCESCASYIR